jgi:hypothetical protein
VEPEFSIAEALITAGGLGLAVYFVCTAFVAVLYRVMPDLIETRRGPRGFEIHAELRRDAIAFTNASSQDWNCTAAIGYTIDTNFRTPPFPLGPGQTRVMQFVDVRPAGSTVEPSVLRAVARDQLEAMCIDPSGRSHWGFLK